MNLINSIDDYLLSKEGRPRESHYASDATACIRQLYYKWNNTPPSNPIEAGALWKMRMGDAIHSLIHEFLVDSGYDIIDEVAQRKNYPDLKFPVSVRADAIFSHDGKYYGVEVKSSYGQGIVQIQKKNAPKPEHMAQMALYADIFGIDKWILIYIGRDNGYRTQFTFTYSPEGILVQDNGEGKTKVKDIVDRLAFVEECVGADELPDREYKAAIKNGEIKDMFQKDNVKYSTVWNCGYCPFRNMCWKEYTDESRETGKSFFGEDEV